MDTNITIGGIMSEMDLDVRLFFESIIGDIMDFKKFEDLKQYVIKHSPNPNIKVNIEYYSKEIIIELYLAIRYFDGLNVFSNQEQKVLTFMCMKTFEKEGLFLKIKYFLIDEPEITTIFIQE